MRMDGTFTNSCLERCNADEAPRGDRAHARLRHQELFKGGRSRFAGVLRPQLDHRVVYVG